jgi:hypothetical protein
MAPYGSPAHRTRHFFVKGLVILLTSAFLPLLLPLLFDGALLPKEASEFVFAAGVCMTGWFWVIAFGESFAPKQPAPFHMRRSVFHVIILAWIIACAVGYTTLYAPSEVWALLYVIFATMGAVYPAFAILSHVHHHVEHLLDEQQKKDMANLTAMGSQFEPAE